MSERSCSNCMVFKKGDCLGQAPCDLYEPTPSSGIPSYWPKTMRSRNSYAGYDSSDYNWAKSSKHSGYSSKNNKENAYLKKADLVKRFDFHKKSYDNPGSVDVFLRFFSGEVITWISYDVIRSGANNIFKSKCLLQLNDHILHVDSEIPETDIEKALCRGIYDVSVRFKKSCKIYLITDRELFHGPDYRSTNIKSELLFNALNTFEEKGCSITEIIVKDGYKLIHNQVCNPSTEIVEITDSNISAPKSTDVNEVSTELTVAENKAKTDVMDRELPPRGPNDTLKLRAEKNFGIKKTTEVINNDKVQVKKEMNQPAIPGELRLKCRVCNSMFAMSPSEVDFYKKKGFQMPQRCKACREKGVRYSNKDYYDRGIKRNSRFV